MFADLEFRFLVPFVSKFDKPDECKEVVQDFVADLEANTYILFDKKAIKPTSAYSVEITHSGADSYLGGNYFVSEIGVAFEVDSDLGQDEGDDQAIKQRMLNFIMRALDPKVVAARNFTSNTWKPAKIGWDSVTLHSTFKGLQVSPVDFFGDYADYVKATDSYSLYRKSNPLPAFFTNEEV